MNETKTAVCTGCPYSASIEVAVDEVRQNEKLHRSAEDRTATLGYLALKQKVLEGVASTVDCAGPQQSSNNIQVCNIVGATKEAIDNLIGPNQNAKTLIHYTSYLGPEDIEGEEHPLSDGQYL